MEIRLSEITREFVQVIRERQGNDTIITGINSVEDCGPGDLVFVEDKKLVEFVVAGQPSGVVLPAFLPLVPGLTATVGNIEPLPIAWSMNVGASLVDMSSLSTVGALFLAATPAGTDTRQMFNSLLAWGLSMSIVGALLCWLLLVFLSVSKDCPADCPNEADQGDDGSEFHERKFATDCPIRTLEEKSTR